MAQRNGSNRSRGGGGSTYSRGYSNNSSRSYAPRYSGGSGRSFAPSRSYGYSGRSGYYSRGYVTHSYRRPLYRGYYRGGVWVTYGLPYAYVYDPTYIDPGYAYDPSYSYQYGPAPAPCTQGGYDQYGNPIGDPNCYAQPQPQQQQPYYDPNQQQPYYDPNQPQPYNR